MELVEGEEERDIQEVSPPTELQKKNQPPPTKKKKKKHTKKKNSDGNSGP